MRRFVRSADPIFRFSPAVFHPCTLHPAFCQLTFAGVSVCVTTVAFTPRRRCSTAVMLATPPLACFPLCVTAKTTGNDVSSRKAWSDDTTALSRAVLICRFSAVNICCCNRGALISRLKGDHHVSGRHVRMAVCLLKLQAVSVRTREQTP